MLQLPSIPDLQAFEAAARRLSFLHAAKELNVTPGAISRRLQNLEALLGTPLFTRHHKQVELTAKGRDYLAEISDPLSRIGAATQQLRAQQNTDVISICVYPTFAFRWLIPRWGRFYDSHPEVDLRLTTSLSPVDFDRDGYDLAILIWDRSIVGDGQTEGRVPASNNRGAALLVEKLIDVVLYPVCAPQLADGLKTPEDLCRQILLHAEPRPDDWPRWLESAGLNQRPEFADPGFDASRGPRFASSNLAIQAAVEGLGVVIGLEALIQDELAHGRLVRPFDLARRSGSPFQIVYPKAKRDWPQLNWFRDWLLAEAAG